MIESIMYFGIGFLSAGLTVLIVVPLVHGRAVRLTTRQLQGTLPSSVAEALAHGDLLRAEFAISTRRLETRLEESTTKSANQLAELGRNADVVNGLRMEVDGLRDRLRNTEQLSAAKANEARELRRLASQQESSMLEIATATQTTSQQLVEEQRRFTNFRNRVAELVRQATLQISEERNRGRCVQEDLQGRLIAQSQLLSESGRELDHLRGELDIAHKVESAMRNTVIQIEHRADAATENFKLENARLRGALDRANGERIRLAYELAAATKQIKDTEAA